jgi:hypothetical protein
MSVIRPKLPEDPIEYEPAAALAAGGGARKSLDAIAGPLERARRGVLDSATVVGPDRLLDAYKTPGARAASELFAVLQTAVRIRDAADRMIVLGDGRGALGARAVFDACAHPCHNELSRGERGGKPRLSFACSLLDSDAVQGLLDLVAPAGRPRSGDLLDRWAVMIADTAGDGAGMEVAARFFLASLVDSVGGDRAALADRLVVVAAADDRLARLATAVGCTQVFTIPQHVGAGEAVFTPLGLLPAAVAGIDVVRLLEGAAALNRRFREASTPANPVLAFAAAPWLMAEQGHAARRLASPLSQLDALCRWHDRLADRADASLITSLIAREPRRDPLVVPPAPEGAATADGGDRLAGTNWPDLSAVSPPPAQVEGTDRILLPRVDEHAIGQLLQLLVLAERLHPGRTL